MFSPALGDESLFSVLKKNKTSSTTTLTYSNIVKLGKNRFIVGRSKTSVLFQLNEKSIYEVADKSMKVLSMFPYESIRVCAAKPNKLFVVNDNEYISDVNLQIVAEIKQRIQNIADKRQSKMHMLQSHINSQGEEPSLSSTDKDMNSEAEDDHHYMQEGSPRKDKLSRLLGISKNERLDMEADRIILDQSSEEGMACIQYVRDFPAKYSGGYKNPLSEVRLFLDKMKRFIVKKRSESFEVLVQSGSLASNIFLGNSMLEIDSDTREKNDAIEKSLERAILNESVRKVLWNYMKKIDLSERDTKLEAKLQNVFSRHDQSYFQIPEDLQSSTEWIHCANLLHKLNSAVYPYEMVQIVLDTYRSIPKVFQEEHSDRRVTLAADDILPIMIFIVTRAELQSPLQKMEYIVSIMDPLIRSQEEGYAATIFSSALSVLDDMLPSDSTNVDDKESNDTSKNEFHSTNVPCTSTTWTFKSPTSGETIFTQSYFPLNLDDILGHVICLHDLHEHSGRGKILYDRLLQANYVVHLMDMVGHGFSTGHRGYIESIETLVSDFSIFVNKIEENNGKRLPLFGVGQGIGSSVLFHASIDKPNVLRGCCFISPIFFLNRNYTSLLSPRFLEKFAPKSGLVDFSISTDSKVLEVFQKDPLSLKQKLIVKTGCAILRSQARIPTLLDNFKTPFLFLRAEYDHISDTQNDDQFYDFVPVADKELQVFSACHALLQGSQKLPIINSIYNWIYSRTILNASPVEGVEGEEEGVESTECVDSIKGVENVEGDSQKEEPQLSQNDSSEESSPGVLEECDYRGAEETPGSLDCSDNKVEQVVEKVEEVEKAEEVEDEEEVEGIQKESKEIEKMENYEPAEVTEEVIDQSESD